MLNCWEINPKDRPAFSSLVSSLSHSLEAMAGYMDVNTFKEVSPNAINSETSEQPRDHLSNSLELESSLTKVSQSQDVTVETTTGL